jgi:effector-binding domain-containing protein
MTYQCERTEVESQPTISIRTRAAVQDLPQVLGASYGLLASYLQEIGEPMAGAPFVAYYNMDMADLDLEIGLPLAQPLPGRDEIQAGTIPGGTVVRCLHIGPYPEVGAAYDALGQWMAAQDLEGAGPAYEFYLNDPAETPPAELQTLIVMPIK